MTPQINAVLDEIRVRLESAFGPELAGYAADSHYRGEPGEGEAANQDDIEDTLDLYLNAIVGRLEQEFDFDEDEAIGLTFDVIDEMTEEGMLPPFPDEGASPDMLATWIGKAKSVGLQAHVIEAAQEILASE